MSDHKEPYTIQISRDPNKSPWWQHDVASVLQPQSREMLETYAGVPADKVIDHIEHYVRQPNK